MNQSVSENSNQKENIIQVSADQLPLSCPTKGNKTWSEHPKVYLDLSKTGKASCPYCGAQYQIKN